MLLKFKLAFPTTIPILLICTLTNCTKKKDDNSLENFLFLFSLLGRSFINYQMVPLQDLNRGRAIGSNDIYNIAGINASEYGDTTPDS